MRREIQIEVAKRILAHVAARSTDRLDTVHYNEVTAFTSAERFARERAILFHDYPQLVALSCQLRNPGDFLTNEDTDVPILVVRSSSGKANAFANVCRHRGNRVATGCGSGRRDFMCSYHGWTYGLEGELAVMTDPESFRGVDPKRSGLVPLPIEEKHGMIFVLPKPGGRIDVDAHLQGLEDDLAGYRLEGYHHYASRTLRRPQNWKLVVDTFLETYHFATLHGSTVGPLFYGNTNLYDGFGRNVRLVGVRRSIAKAKDLAPGEWDLLPHIATVNLVFPNSIVVYQGDHVELWSVYPSRENLGECVMHASLFAPEPVTEKAARHWDANWDLLFRTVENEDFPAGESIFRGCQSGAQGYLTYGRNEPCLAHFHQEIRRAIGLGDLPTEIPA